MATGLKTVIYPVKDIAAAVARFTAVLGEQPYVDEPYYAAFNVGGDDLGLDPHGHQKGLTGPTPYWHVPDAAGAVAALVEQGATVQQEPTDVGGGNLTATVVDPDGNVVGFMQEV